MAGAQIDVKADEGRNRLFITIGGTADNQKSQELIDNLDSALKKLSPGFTVLSDLTKMNVVSPTYLIVARKVMKAVKDAKPGRLARVVNPLIGMQMTRIGKLVGSSAKHFKTVPEANAYLDEKV